MVGAAMDGRKGPNCRLHGCTEVSHLRVTFVKFDMECFGRPIPLKVFEMNVLSRFSFLKICAVDANYTK